MISSRLETILRYLIQQDDFVAVKHIASELQVSTKTVYRELVMIESVQGIKLQRKPGLGVRVIELDDSLLEVVDNERIDENDPDKRRREIFRNLLKESNSTTSIQKLSQKYYVSQTSIINDLKHVKTWLDKFDISIVSTHEGTSIIGDEKDFRNAYNSSLISMTNDLSYALPPSESRIDDTTLRILNREFGSSDVEFVEKLVKRVERCLYFEIVDPYYINLVTHILILVQRLKSGNCVKDIEVKTTEVRTHFLTIASSISQELTDFYNISVPQEETLYIYQHLDSIGGNVGNHNHLEQLKQYQERVSPQLVMFCDSLIKNVEEILSISISNDEILKGFLLVHLHAVINRQKYGISIECPLKDVIVEEYSTIFNAVAVSVNRSLKDIYPMYQLSSDECCYIALYFQSAVERVEKEQLRVLVVCSSGVGTSPLVMSRLKKRLNSIEVVDHVAVSYLTQELVEDMKIDFIVSTVNIEDSIVNLPIVFISVLVNQFDIKLIVDQMKTMV